MPAGKITTRFAIAILLCVSLPAAHGQELVTLPTRDGVTQSYLLEAPPHPPHAVAVLFPGGGGNIRLRRADGRIGFSPNNFLVRSRHEFVQRGIAAAVVDAPSDRQSGMDDDFRSGNGHQTDLQVVVANLNRRFPAIPVFLVGTSRGTVSAAYLGRAFGPTVAGVVLTASVFLPSGKRALHGGHGLSGFDFSGIKSPLLLVHHRDDGCRLTPYRAAQRLAERFPLVSVSGGKPAVSPPCEALSEHGFLGREAKTVEAIVNWMLKRPYASEIN
jgi:alpha-beta hydrolase superfamily lysophospholipase